MNSVSSWGVGEAEQRGPYLFVGKLAKRVETPAHRVRQAGDARDLLEPMCRPAGSSDPALTYPFARPASGMPSFVS